MKIIKLLTQIPVNASLIIWLLTQIPISTSGTIWFSTHNRLSLY